MSTFVGRRLPGQTVRITREPMRLPLLVSIAWWLIKITVRLLIMILRSPAATAAVVLGVGGLLLGRAAGGGVGGLGVVLAAYAFLAAVFLGVCLICPRLVLWLRARWRRFSIYAHRWSATMDMCELNRTRQNGVSYEPVLLKVRSTPNVDQLRVRLLAGQTLDQWARASDGLRQTFGADDVRVRSVPGKPREAELWFLINDPLREVVQPGEVEVPVRLDALPIGLREDGQTYRLPLLGNHTFIGGATGAGKSGWIWSIVRALSPAIADGSCRLIGVDPKRAELSFGEDLFYRLAWQHPADYADVLEFAVEVMQTRQAAQRGVTRKHHPSPAEPLYVVLIDELGALTLVSDRETRRRIENALGLLLQQGRAVGISVVGAMQDPRKESLPVDRGLFTVRIALRLTEADQVVLILGAAAKDRGAHCDQIPESLQGVGFVQVDGVAEPIRVRSQWIDDDEISALSAGWRPVIEGKAA